MSLLARTETAPAAAVRPIRVFLADDHPLTLWGLRQLVQSDHPRMSLAGTASTCAGLLAHEALAQTDVVLLDLGLGDGNTIECLAQLVESAGVQVVVLTGDLNPAHHREAVLRLRNNCTPGEARPRDFVPRSLTERAAEFGGAVSVTHRLEFTEIVITLPLLGVLA